MSYRRRHKALGDVCTVLQNGMSVCLPSPSATTTPAVQPGRRNFPPSRARNNPQPWQNWNSRPNNPQPWQSQSYGSVSTSSALQTAQNLLATNPAALTTDQLTLLQQNGISTAAYSAAVAAATPATVSAVATVAAPALSLTDPTTWPWYMWVGIAGAGYLFVRNR